MAKAKAVAPRATKLLDRPAKPKPAWLPQDAPAQVKLNPDGEMHRADLEGLALLLADDVPGPTAWVQGLGKNNSGPPGRLRRYAEKHPVFLERLERLKQEKAALQTDPTWGHVEWMAKQLWREARLKNDMKAMVEAADLAFKVAKQKADTAPKAASAEPDEEGKNPVGRPAKTNPQSIRDPATLRGLLVTYGEKAEKTAPESPEDDD